MRLFVDDDLFGVNKAGHLTIGGVDTIDLAKKFGTPLYVIDENYFRARCDEIKKALFKVCGNRGGVCFASKSFCCKEIFRVVASENLNVDTVSIGEMFTAVEAGFNCEKIYLHGNNKLKSELEFALDHNIGRIIVDNFEELYLLEKLATEKNKKVNVLLRLKPGIEAHVHEFVQTGQIGSKFGFAIETGEALQAVEKAISLKNINLLGAHCHIGSQILEIEPFVLAAKKMIGFFSEVKIKTGFEFEELNLGGGFGINYLPDGESLNVENCFAQVFSQIKKSCEEFKLKVPFLLVEPGRFLIAKAGITLYTIGCIKKIPNLKTYVFVDGGMADNPRYALYKSDYDAVVANRANLEKTEIVSVAGKCCESGDLIGEKMALQKAEVNDLLAVFATGAYNYSMASNYNRITRPAVVFVKNSNARLVVRRESLQDLIKNDV